MYWDAAAAAADDDDDDDDDGGGDDDDDEYEYLPPSESAQSQTWFFWGPCKAAKNKVQWCTMRLRAISSHL